MTIFVLTYLLGWVHFRHSTIQCFRCFYTHLPTNFTISHMRTPYIQIQFLARTMSKLSKLWKKLSLTLPCQKRKSKEQYSTEKVDKEAPKVALRLPSIILVSERDETATMPKPKVPAMFPMRIEKRTEPVPSQKRYVRSIVSVITYCLRVISISHYAV